MTPVLEKEVFPAKGLVAPEPTSQKSLGRSRNFFPAIIGGAVGLNRVIARRLGYPARASSACPSVRLR